MVKSLLERDDGVKDRDRENRERDNLTKVFPLAIKMVGVIRCHYFPARISTCQNLLMNLTYLIVSAALPVTVCCQRMYGIFSF